MTSLARFSTKHLIAALFVISVSVDAIGQSYPSRTVQLILGFSPGGGSDTTGRVLASKMFGGRVVLVNKPGASGNIAGELVANAPPDGYTLLLAPIAHAMNAGLFPDLPFDPVKSFEPVSLIATAPSAIVIHPSVPANDLRGLIALLKANPDKYNYGSSGPGTPSHFAGVLFMQEAGAKMTHVPYKGGGQALAGLLGGQIQIYIVSTPTVAKISSAKAKVLAVTGLSRSPTLPSVPTAREAGLPNYHFVGWYGMVAPPKTPRSIVDQLHAEIVRALKTPEVIQNLAADGATPVGSSPEEFRNFLDAEVKKWAKVAKTAQAK